MTYPTHPIPTTVVGSYPQPDWLVDRSTLEHHGVPRVAARDIWRIPEPLLEQAQDDATILAIREMERAGIDIVSDGEIRRESYSNRFALALDGIDAEHPGHVGRSGGGTTPVPRVVGKIRRKSPVELRDAEFLLRHAAHATKITLPGPFTLSQQAENAFYADEEELAMDYAIAVNEELRALKASGVDVVQLDEPWVRTAPDKAARYGVKAINRALDGITGPTVVHLCFGYAAMVKNKPAGYAFLPQLADSAAGQISIEAAQPRLDLGVLRDLAGKTVVLGVLDLNDPAIETAESVAARLREALRYVPAERLPPAPGWGLENTPRARRCGGSYRQQGFRLMRTLLMALGGLALAGLSVPAAAQLPNNTAAEVSVLRPSANTLVYHAGSDRHFVVPGTANGAPMRFLVDTGATLVVLTPSDARPAGIAPSALVFDRAMRTASGTVPAATTVLRDVRVGRISIGDVLDAGIANAPQPALRMRFFTRSK